MSFEVFSSGARFLAGRFRHLRIFLRLLDFGGMFLAFENFSSVPRILAGCFWHLRFFLRCLNFGGKFLAFENFSSVPRILAGSFWHLRIFLRCLVFQIFPPYVGIHIGPVCRFQYQAECSWQRPGPSY